MEIRHKHITKFVRVNDTTRLRVKSIIETNCYEY